MRGLGVIASLAFGLSHAAAQEIGCVAIPEVLDAALGTAPAVTRAEADREIARAQVLAARSQTRPQVSLFGQAGIGNTQPLDQIRDDQIGVQANLELYSFGQRSAEIAAARETLRAAQAGELQAQTEVAERAILLYFELLRVSRLLELTSAQTEGYAQEAATVRTRLERGLVTRSDARQIEARYASALARREEAEITKDEIQLQLSIFLGDEVSCVNPVSARALGDALATRLGTIPVGEALAMAQNNAFGIKQARAEVRSQEARVRAADRAGRPTLSLNAFVLGQYNDSTLPIDDRWEQDDRVGFSLRQNIYSGGKLQAERAETRGRLRRSEADLVEARRQLEVDVRTAVLGVLRQGAIAQRRSAAAEAAYDRLEATRLELRRGSKTITDFVLANEDYYTAAIEEASAGYVRDQELVRLASLTGLLLDLDVVTIQSEAPVVLP
jgi:outer membrane protein TolC